MQQMHTIYNKCGEVLKYIALPILASLVLLFGCHDPYGVKNTFSVSELAFSSDTVRMDTLYSNFPSATHRLVVYNRGSKPLVINSVQLLPVGDTCFRVNVDGRSGTVFEKVSILPKDSIYVFIEASFMRSDLPGILPASAQLKFSSDKESRSVRIEAWHINVDKVSSLIIQKDTTLAAVRPLFIKDSVVVEKEAVLTLPEGAHLLMGNRAKLIVKGRLKSLGSAARPVLIEGLRRDNLIPDVNYRVLPGQWENVTLCSGSGSHILNYTHIRNGRGGLVVGDDAEAPFKEVDVQLNNCRITNMKRSCLTALNARVNALNCEFSNSLWACVDLKGGSARFSFCTVAGFYVFDHRLSKAVELHKGEGNAYPTVTFEHCVIDGNASVVRQPGREAMGGELPLKSDERAQIKLVESYVKTPLELFPDRQGCVEATLPPDSVYLHVGRNIKKDEYDFKYDFRPREKAPFVKRAATAPLTDLLGQKRTPPAAWGAYEPNATAEEEWNSEK